MPRVSVIIATFNWSAALRLAIRSVLAQTFDDLELLVIGDACTDDSPEVVAAANDPRVQWYNLPERAGSQAGPNNAGIERARGEYIAYHGHDDLWHPEHLATLLRALDESQADLAYAGAILYGPRETDMRGVTGVLPPLHGETLRFVAPSSIAHRRDLVARIGPWRNHREERSPVDYEFLRRAWELRNSFTQTNRITVFKFPAAWRRDAYRTKTVDDQEALLHRMQTDPDFLERELFALVVALSEHRMIDVAKSVEAAPGEVIEITKRFKGAADESAPLERVDRLRYEFDRLVPGLEWHPPERHPTLGPFQWSGPGTRSSLDLPLRTDRDLRIAIKVLAPVAKDIFESLRLTVNGDPIALAATREASGTHLLEGRIEQTTLAKAGGATRLTFEVNRTIAPSDLNPASRDHRRLGVAFNWVEIGPV